MKTYLGYTGESISFAAKTRHEIENLPGVIITKIEEVEYPVELIDGVYYVGEGPIEDAKKQSIRQIRNKYLERYVDPIVSNPLRWEDMSQEDQENYIEYRLYLLRYTDKPRWWDEEPLTFDEWLNN